MSTSFPTHASFEVTHRCNFYCVHCYIIDSTASTPEMPLRKIKSIFDNLADLGVLHLTFTGGEPFMRRNLLDIVEAARERRFSVHIITNGSMLSRAKITRLSSLKPTRVDVSLYGHDEATYYKVTGVRGMYRRVIKTLDELAMAKVPVLVKSTLLRENVSAVETLKTIARDRGFGIMFSPLITAGLSGSTKPFKHALAPAKVVQLMQRGVLSKPMLRAGGKQMCRVGSDNILVGPDGILYPCLEIREAVAQLPVNDIRHLFINSEVLKRLRALSQKKITTCPGCSIVKYCSPCPGAHERVRGKTESTPQCRTLKALQKAGLLGD